MLCVHRRQADAFSRTTALSFILTPKTASSECISLWGEHSSEAWLGFNTWRGKCVEDPLQSLTSYTPPHPPTPTKAPDADGTHIPPAHPSFKGHLIQFTAPPPKPWRHNEAYMTELLAPFFPFWWGCQLYRLCCLSQ